MNPILRLFLKDARHLWPQVLVYVAILVLRLSYYSSTERYFVLLGPLAYLALWVLITALIHEEPLIGDGQYWLARPITRGQLIAAKALFVLAFILLPLLVGQAVVLKDLGFPLLDSLPDLLIKAIVFTVAWILPAAALAAITRNLPQMVLAVLIGFILLVIAGTVYRTSNFSTDWGEFDWIKQSILLAVLALGSCLVLLLQYFRRKKGTAWILSTVVALVVFATSLMPAGSWVFSIQKHFSRQEIDHSAVQITIDAMPDKSYSVVWGKTDPDSSIIRIPIHIERLPPKLDTYFAAIQLKIDAGHAGESQMDWSISRGGLQGTVLQPRIVFAVNTRFYESVKDLPVRVTGFIDMTLLDRRPAQLDPRIYGDQYVPGAGVCEIPGFGFERANIYCRTPWPRAHVEVSSGAERIGSFASSDECAPWPVTASFDPVKRPPLSSFGGEGHPQPDRWILTRPVAHIRRHFDFQKLHLRDYFVK